MVKWLYKSSLREESKDVDSTKTMVLRQQWCVVGIKGRARSGWEAIEEMSIW